LKRKTADSPPTAELRYSEVLFHPEAVSRRIFFFNFLLEKEKYELLRRLQNDDVNFWNTLSEDLHPFTLSFFYISLAHFIIYSKKGVKDPFKLYH